MKFSFKALVLAAAIAAPLAQAASNSPGGSVPKPTGAIDWSKVPTFVSIQGMNSSNVMVAKAGSAAHFVVTVKNGPCGLKYQDRAGTYVLTTEGNQIKAGANTSTSSSGPIGPGTHTFTVVGVPGPTGAPACHGEISTTLVVNP
ncbi:MAG: hypothetical protein JNM76_16985 [Betaproteobacteria bacterium]|nr:hypothetical protein [Betaproteobacteria bacterium]